MSAPTLAQIGRLALDHSVAIKAVCNAKHAYHEEIAAFEAKFGRAEGRIDPHDPRYSRVIAQTSLEYEAFQAARRSAYNAKRRLLNACRRFKCAIQ